MRPSIFHYIKYVVTSFFTHTKDESPSMFKEVIVELKDQQVQLNRPPKLSLLNYKNIVLHLEINRKMAALNKALSKKKSKPNWFK